MMTGLGEREAFSVHAFRLKTVSVLAALLFTGVITSISLAGRVEARGPESLSGLAEKVMDAVVNISASTNVPAEQQRATPMPQLPPGTPFQEFFDEFMNPKGGNGGTIPQHKSSSLGSGFVIDASGIVVTNNHVIGDADEIMVVFNDGRKLRAEIIGKDPKVDIAVLRVKPDKPLVAVTFGDSDAEKIGDWVMAIGNPFGLGGSVSAGIISAKNRDISDQSYGQYLQTDAAINKGNSGGPLFNMEGEVIGINTAILSPTGGSIGIGFAVPSALAGPVVEQLRQFGETRRGWLGVRIQAVDQTIAETLGLGEPRGALVAGVDEKGPSKAAGLEAGDVIVTFDGKPIKESRDLPRLVGQTAVGRVVAVGIIRKGKELSIPVTLGRLDETDKQAKAGTPTQPEQPVVKKTMGLELVGLTDELRKRFSIKDTVKGALVLKVDPNSPAADKRFTPGDVIVEVQQEAVGTPEAVIKRIEAVKKDGKKSVLLLVANPQGEVRFVALAIE
jgi:serine protease Do